MTVGFRKRDKSLFDELNEFVDGDSRNRSEIVREAIMEFIRKDK